MTKEVLVHITGLHLEAGTDVSESKETETIEVVVPGNYYLKNGKKYILYEEIEEDGRITKNQVKVFEDGHVEIRKSGVLNTQMIFETGKRNQSNYQTPFGVLPVTLDTRVIDVTESEHKFCVEIDYSLEVQEKPVSDCRIEICITER